MSNSAVPNTEFEEQMEISEMTSEALFEEARSEDSLRTAACFDELVRRHNDQLIRHIKRTCKLNDDDAEEVAQEVWIKLMKAKLSSMPKNFIAFLNTTGRNAGIDRIAYKDRRQTVSYHTEIGDGDDGGMLLNTLGEEDDRLPTVEEDPNPEAASTVDDLLASMTEEEREIAGTLMSGMGPTEAAGQLGMKVTTYTSKRKKLRKKLEGILGDNTAA